MSRYIIDFFGENNKKITVILSGGNLQGEEVVMRNRIEIRTDLALEEKEQIIPEKGIADGVVFEVFKDKEDVKVTVVRITNENGSRLLNKPIGEYYTVEAEDMCYGDRNYHHAVAKVVSECLKELLMREVGYIPKRTLVAGLGNREVTADAIGPKVVDNILISERVMSIAPGVLAQTGIETASIIKSIVKEISPEVLIVIDALAARSIKRLNRTIQLSNSGIYPGQGVGNHRLGITEEYVGCPVIAVGVPTVVDAPTIISDTLQELFESFKYDEEEGYKYIKEKVSSEISKMFVTPKDIDEKADVLGITISEAINITFE